MWAKDAARARDRYAWLHRENDLFWTVEKLRGHFQQKSDAAGLAEIAQLTEAISGDLRQLSLEGKGVAGVYGDRAAQAVRERRIEAALRCYHDSERVWQSLCTKFPENPTHPIDLVKAHEGFGDLCLAHGYSAEAAGAFKKAIESYTAHSSALDTYHFESYRSKEDAAKRPPRALAAHCFRCYRYGIVAEMAGNAQEGQMEVAKTLAEAEKFCKAQPGSEAEMKMVLADRMVTFAEKLQAAKRYLECQTVARETLRLLKDALARCAGQQTEDRQFLTSRWTIAVCLLRASLAPSGRQEEADPLLAALLEKTPGDALVRNLAALRLTLFFEPQSADVAWAAKLAKEAVALAPEREDFWNTLGLVEYRAGNWVAAKAAVEKSILLSSSNAPMANLGAYGVRRLDGDGKGDCFDWLLLAMIEWKAGNRLQAQAWYDRAVTEMERNAGMIGLWERQRDTMGHAGRLRAEATALLGCESGKQGVSKEVALP